MTSPRAIVGILVGGGPAPGINSVISAVTIRSILGGCDVVGIIDGFKWLMEGSESRVRSHHHNQVGQIEILNGIGRRRGTERFHHAGDGRAVADTGTVVDVVRPDHTTHELGEEIIFFVRASA